MAPQKRVCRVRADCLGVSVQSGRVPRDRRDARDGCDGMSLEGRRGIPGANLIYFQARPGQHADAGYGQSPAAVER
jgi:hypothetical protein